MTTSRIKINNLLKMQPGVQVQVKGWVRTKRGNKNITFIALNDGSTIYNIQIVCDMSVFTDEQLRSVTTGACLRVNGQLIPSVGSGQDVEVQASEIEIYGTADANT
ncbi:MAG: OB-fold nucleic acid binding domain-containing protein, partial [Bacteroidales bacterium]